MKNIILSLGESLLSLIVFAGIIIAILINVQEPGGMSILIGLAIIIGIVVSTFFIYLLIDIRDKNRETNNLLRNLLEQNNITQNNEKAS